jgi:uncharacterized protein (UPF0332 family)
MNMTLDEWVKKDWIEKHKPTPREISNLLKIVDRDIKQSQIKGLNNDTRLSIAYNAALQCCAAALSASGYRAKHGAYHYHLIQSLTFTLKLDENQIRIIDNFRRKRNISEYERTGAVSEKEAERMLEIAEDLHDKVKNWLLAHYPELVKET